MTCEPRSCISHLTSQSHSSLVAAQAAHLPCLLYHQVCLEYSSTPSDTIYSIHHSEHPLTTHLHCKWQEQKTQNQCHTKKPQVMASTQSECNKQCLQSDTHNMYHHDTWTLGLSSCVNTNLSCRILELHKSFDFPVTHLSSSSIGNMPPLSTISSSTLGVFLHAFKHYLFATSLRAPSHYVPSMQVGATVGPELTPHQITSHQGEHQVRV